MKGNYHILSDEQLKLFEDKFEVSYEGGNYMIFKTKNYGTTTAKPIHKGFNVLVKTDERTIYQKINIKAIDYWINENKNNDSIFKIMNSINKLKSLSQTIDSKSISKMLKM